MSVKCVLVISELFVHVYFIFICQTWNYNRVSLNLASLILSTLSHVLSQTLMLRPFHIIMLGTVIYVYIYSLTAYVHFYQYRFNLF